jgi:hypothetical protein
MCICITHLEMNIGLVSSLNLTNKLAPHFSHFLLCGNFQRKQDVKTNFVIKTCLSLITGKPEKKEKLIIIICKTKVGVLSTRS